MPASRTPSRNAPDSVSAPGDDGPDRRRAQAPAHGATRSSPWRTSPDHRLLRGCSAYMSFPKEHRAKLHALPVDGSMPRSSDVATSSSVRLRRRIKRRSRPVFGRSTGRPAPPPHFPNEDAITRLVGAVLLEQNDEWAVSRRYITLESIAQTSDNLPIKLPAVAVSLERPGPNAGYRLERDAPTPRCGTRPHIDAIGPFFPPLQYQFCCSGDASANGIGKSLPGGQVDGTPAGA